MGRSVFLGECLRGGSLVCVRGKWGMCACARMGVHRWEVFVNCVHDMFEVLCMLVGSMWDASRPPSPGSQGRRGFSTTDSIPAAALSH